MANIGFIGIGNMGGPMALNLVKAGHTVKVFDLNEAAVKALASQGVKIANSLAEVVSDVAVVISMLPSGAIVENLYIHQDRLLQDISKDTLVIDCSTIAPENARNVASVAKEQGIAMIDAPVSGGTAGASAATLTFICGGAAEHVEKAKPYLSAMGKNIFHAGDSGAGQVAKICNNMLLAVHMIGTAEALQMGVNNGLDPNVLSNIMLQSSGRNWSLELYNPYPGVMENVPASKEYQGGFMVDLMNKDLGLAVEVALQSASSTPMGNLAKSLYGLHGIKGNGKLDFSSIQKMFQTEK